MGYRGIGGSSEKGAVIVKKRKKGEREERDWRNGRTIKTYDLTLIRREL